MTEILIIQIFSPIFSLVVAYLAYRWGLKSQRIQALREYITTIVRDEYPVLSSEIKFNISMLDDFLEYPLENFSFPELDQFYNGGLDVFMKRHHNDLFLSLDFLKRELAPKLQDFNKIVGESIKRIFEAWKVELNDRLPDEAKEKSREISYELVRTICPNYVFKDLLNNRRDEVIQKIEKCILEKTGNNLLKKAKPYPIGFKKEKVLEKAQKLVKYNDVSQILLEKAKPDVDRIQVFYKELKEISDKKVMKELLPMLHEYISNPI